MIVAGFDLSSKCIGIVVAEVKDDMVTKIMSCPISPPDYDPSELGFLKSKKQTVTSKGEKINSYMFPDEEYVTKKEKEKRDTLVRNQKDIFMLSYISERMGKLIDGIKPDLILLEQNAIFNGVLTSVLLAKVSGTLHGLAGRIQIPVKEYPVSTIRKNYNVVGLTREFIDSKTEDELQQIPNLTKRALSELMVKKYNIKFLTDDESDACLLFDFWFENER